MSTRPELSGSFGMVSSTHWLSAATGMGMLERGGNAFDAAVAAALVLQVVEPHLNGPGGDVSVLFKPANSDKVKVLCGQGVLPAAASIDCVLDKGLSQIPGTGLLAACVPGSFRAWMELLRDYGSRSLEDIISPAISYARGGFRLLERASLTIASSRDLFLNHWTSSAEIYLEKGKAPKGGVTWRNLVLADTYQRVLEEAKSVGSNREAQIDKAIVTFYEGFIAEAIDGFFATEAAFDDSGRQNKGFLTGDDLASWKTEIEDPISSYYRDAQVYKTGPWGQGPVFLQQLKILEGYDLDSLDPTSSSFVHLVAEAAKLSLADRDSFYGDPNFVDVPLDALLSADYAVERRKLIGDMASMEYRPGAPNGRLPWIPSVELMRGLEGGRAMGLPPDPISRDTCQLDVTDRFGNVISTTPSGGWLHGSPCIPGLGFSISTRAQMCWLDPKSPSAFIGGRRPRTTLSPTIVLKDDGEFIAFGTPGGDQQDQWSLTFFLRYMHWGGNLQAAIDLPSFHTQHMLSSFYPRELKVGRLDVESRFSEKDIKSLKEMGHSLQVAGPWSLGRVCAVSNRNGELKAGSDPRQDQAYSVGR